MQGNGDPLDLIWLIPLLPGLGAVLQDENIAVGAFFGTNASGSFLLKAD